jgi:phage tail-like protein
MSTDGDSPKSTEEQAAESDAKQEALQAENQERADAAKDAQEAYDQQVADAQAAMEAQRQAEAEALANQQAAYEAELDQLQAGQEALEAEEKAKSDYDAERDAMEARRDALLAREEEGEELTAEEQLELLELQESLAYEEQDYATAENPFATETTALEDLEASWDEHGLMGVYADRHLLIDALGSTFFKWFPPQRRFPEVNFNFVVMAGLDFLGEFQSVSGIGFDVPVKTVNEGGRHHSPHYLPFDGPGKRSNLQLRWGAVSSTSLYKWIEAVRIGWNFHRTVYVIQLARDGWPTRIMRFAGCFPTAWDGADLDTGGSAWALQSLTLVYDRFNMMTMPFDLGAASRQWSG